MNKYGAIKTERDGRVFASAKEARRYAELCLLERAGEISDLKCQPRFELQPAFEYNGKHVRAIYHLADFEYVEGKRLVIEEIKSSATRTPLYEVKRKLLLFKFGSQIDYRIIE